jgi:hypothetical protein
MWRWQQLEFTVPGHHAIQNLWLALPTDRPIKRIWGLQSAREAFFLPKDLVGWILVTSTLT